MKSPPRPLFLARRIYRERRLMDAARVLPVPGAFLFLLPLVWQAGPGEGAGTARIGLYLFVVWAGLIGAAFLMSGRLRRIGEGGPGAGPVGGPARLAGEDPGHAAQKDGGAGG